MLAAAAGALTGAAAQAADQSWKTAASGDWHTAANWGPVAAVPKSTDNAIFDKGSALGYTVSLSGPAVASSLIVKTDKPTLNLSSYNLTLGGALVLGNASGQNAMLTLSGAGAVVADGGSTLIGSTSGASGTLIVDAATLRQRAGTFQNVIVGNGPSSNGTLTIRNGGQVFGVNGYIAGANGASGAAATATMTGATSQWSLSNSLNIGGDETVSSGSGNGALIINGGTVNVGGATRLWNAGNQDFTGTHLDLVAGTLSTGSLNLDAHPWRFRWTGGSLNITSGSLFIETAGTNGNAIVGQTLTAGKNLSVAGTTTVSSGNTLDANGGNFTSGSLLNSGTINCSGDSKIIVLGHEQIAPNSKGTFTQSGGTHTVNGRLTVASGNNTSGTYLLSGGRVNVSEMKIGDTLGASGGFGQTGGSLYVTNSLWLSTTDASATGFYTLSGASILSVGGDEFVGYKGNSTFTQSGGTHTVGGAMTMAWGANTIGCYKLNGGTLAVSNQLEVGDATNASGTLTQTAGYLEAGTLALGTAASSPKGIYAISGGSAAAGSLVLGETGNGTLQQTGGTVTADQVLVTARGRYQLKGGSLTSGNIRVDGVLEGAAGVPGSISTGTGGIVDFRNTTFVQSGALAVTGSSNALMIFSSGFNPATTFGSYANAGVTWNSPGTPVIGVGKTVLVRGDVSTDLVVQGTLAQLPGGTLALSGGLDVRGQVTTDAFAPVRNCTISQTGAQLHVMGDSTLSASMSHTAGAHVVDGNLAIPNGTVADYSLSGTGVLTVAGETNLSGGLGRFTQGGVSTHTVGQNLVIGWYFGSNRYQVTEGATLDVGASLILKGYLATDETLFRQEGGTVHVSDAVVIGSDDSSGEGGRFQMSAGTLSTHNLVLRDRGVLSVTGGTFDVSDTVDASSGLGVSGVQLAGGTFRLGQLKPGADLLLDWTQGTLAITNPNAPTALEDMFGSQIILDPGMTFDVAPALSATTLTVSGGTLAVNEMSATHFSFSSGKVIFKSNAQINSAGLLGAAVNLSSGQSLEVAGTTVIETGSSFHLDGGTFRTGSLENQGSFDFSSGSLLLTNSDLLIGNGGLLGSNVELTPGKSLSVGRTTTIAAGASLWLNGGTFATGTLINNGSFSTNGGTLAGAVSGKITHTSGVLSVEGAKFAPGSELVVNGGSVNLWTDSGAQGANLSLTVNASATATISSEQHLANLTIGAGAKVTAAAGGGSMVTTKGLSIAPGGVFDLTDNDAVFENVSFTQVQAWVFQGYSTNGGEVTTGIVSSIGQTTRGNPILAVFDNALADVTEFPFGSGKTISPTAVAGRFTFIGDADLNGMVTPDDYGAVDSNLGQTDVPAGLAWLYGDYNFDGQVTPDDYLAIDSNLGNGESNPLAATGMRAMGSAAVPEPCGMFGVAVGMGVIMRRRRGPQG
ncbi:MAG TPA: hypothetical protein VF669_14940 [Tepidisphaeraceae bacterium]|jgi:hypothetical protein